MEIRKFAIRRFRGFDRETSIPLSQFTVLTGPNNLGKSTVLRAMGVFFGALRTDIRRVPVRERQTYRFAEDYPKKYEGRPGRRWSTRMQGEFRFSAKDLESASASGLTLKADTKVTLEFPLESDAPRRAPSLAVDGVRELDDVLSFRRWFADSFRYVYIPATRNVEDFRRSVFYELVEGAVLEINQSRRRIEAIERFYQDVRSRIGRIEETLTEELREFLPDIKGVEFVVNELDLLRLVTVRDVEVDDVAKTSLGQKGDGFKSLFAMSVLQYLAKRRHGQNLIFGIEEPEAHLHSSAIYAVKAALRELAVNFQLVLTTHSPILIQRDDLGSNIIVEQLEGDEFAASAKPARNLAAIRASLGIRPQDNMTTAEVVVVVEGATEERAVGPLLGMAQRDVGEALGAGRVRVIGSGGATKAVATIRALARDAANCVVLLDNDVEGSRARDQLSKSGLIGAVDLFQVPQREGCLETEFEDVFAPQIYVDAVAEACGIALTVDEFEDHRRRSGGAATRCAKWSDVMRDVLATRGKDWTELADDAKSAVAESLRDHAKSPEDADYPWIRSIANRVNRYLRES